MRPASRNRSPFTRWPKSDHSVKLPRRPLISQTIDINRIGTDQAAQLVALQVCTFRQAYAEVHAREDIEAYCLAQYTRDHAETDLASADTVCCIGLLNSEPAGYYMVKHQACPVAIGAKSSELKQIYVLRSAYGSGLGRALFDHAVSTIRSADALWVWLCVADNNHRAQAFYDKLGFDRLGSGPVLEVGNDRLRSSILARKL